MPRTTVTTGTNNPHTAAVGYLYGNGHLGHGDYIWIQVERVGLAHGLIIASHGGYAGSGWDVYDRGTHLPVAQQVEFGDVLVAVADRIQARGGAA